jgi:hypothetical protein
VFGIDSGNTWTAEKDELLEMEPRLQTLPAQAVCVQLGGIFFEGLRPGFLKFAST